MNSVVLKDVSLCSIVRDEIMNPAGGIERFVESHVPYVEEAVIVDTGSVDGTREKLEELKNRYSNLKVFDVPFHGYANARNKSLEFVKTKKALILDADELLTHEKPQNDWERLKYILENYSSEVYSFRFFGIAPDRPNFEEIDTQVLRVFTNRKDHQFKSVMGEYLEHSRLVTDIGDRILIKHFVPSAIAEGKKKKNWYGTKGIYSDKERLSLWKKSPSEIDGFCEWKKFNPKRNDYI
ncbi:MAG: glycosyltransferase [Candidatus Pacearchaeota archaeon]